MSALTYRGHPAVTKAMFVADMQAHAAADRLVAGSYDTMQSGHWQVALSAAAFTRLTA